MKKEFAFIFFVKVFSFSPSSEEKSSSLSESKYSIEYGDSDKKRGVGFNVGFLNFVFGLLYPFWNLL